MPGLKGFTFVAMGNAHRKNRPQSKPEGLAQNAAYKYDNEGR